MPKCKVTFHPENKMVTAEKGTTVLNAAIKAGLYLNASCGGNGSCGRCKVIVKKGEFSSPVASNISPKDRKKGWVLSCMTLVEGDLEVFIPVESRLNLEKEKREVEEYLKVEKVFSKTENFYEVASPEAEAKYPLLPLTSRRSVELPAPTDDDRLGDLERICRAVESDGEGKTCSAGLVNMQNLGKVVRDSGWKLSLLLAENGDGTKILSIDPLNGATANYGVAFDIGTTTITGQLIDTTSGTVIASRTTHNRQAVFGSDVITRIIFAKDQEGLEKLHEAVCDNINQIIQDIVNEKQVHLNEITSVACSGNATMIHLLLRIDPTYIRREPYVPTVNEVPVLSAAEAGIMINPRGLLYCSPGVSTYVGGDITSGVLASDIIGRPDISILIDIGTNGEIVLGNSDWLVACAASAGPAFEGSGVACGMRATDGAIEKVSIGSKLDVKCPTIGGSRPKGICGSGYISLIAELLKKKIIGRDGRITNRIKSTRIRKGEDGMEFVLVFKGDSATETDIFVTDADIENLKRSKGAIYSACATLLKKMGIRVEDVSTIYVAGGFGRSIDIDRAIEIGLLPDVARDKFVFAGNTSLKGTRLMLLSGRAREKVRQIAQATTYMELSTMPEYMQEYTSSLFFPHTDLERFPSLRGV